MNQLYILLLALWSAFNSDTSSFLIHNKDHNKCVYAVSATMVQAAPCDVSSKAQRFRWISSSQILSLSFNLCLGSEEVKDWTKIILLPCNDLSPVQTWECKDENLFGLKGHPLHLNYGNHDEPNVMLFSGTGVWSRWLIYGTKENLCSCGYQEIYTRGGNSLGKPCQFPFKFDGKWYTECTVDGRTDGQLWCSTEKDYDTEGKWGFCPPKNVPVPNITVFRQMEDREHMIVMCSFGKKLIESSFQLSLKSEHNYTLNNPLCYSSEKCVFEVKVSPPVSFTCVHETDSVMNRHNLAEDHHEEGVSLFYICFSSFTVVGLFIMTAAVIMTTIRSKSKGSNSMMITGTDNDHSDV